MYPSGCSLRQPIRYRRPLAFVRLDPELGERLVRAVEREPLEGPDVRVELVEGMGASVEVYRRLA